MAEGDLVGLVGVRKTLRDSTAPAGGTVIEIRAENEQEVDAGDEPLALETNRDATNVSKSPYERSEIFGETAG